MKDTKGAISGIKLRRQPTMDTKLSTKTNYRGSYRGQPKICRVSVSKLLIGAFYVAMMLWIVSTLFYVASPIPYWTMSRATNDVVAGEALKEFFPESGSYILPGRYLRKELRQNMRQNGPVATIYISRDGAPAASPFKIAIGTVHSFVVGLMIGVGMLLLNQHTTNYWDHVKIGSAFGIAYTIYPRIADIIWSDFPPGYQLMMVFCDGFTWILATLIMARFTRPQQPEKDNGSPLSFTQESTLFTRLLEAKLDSSPLEKP